MTETGHTFAERLRWAIDRQPSKGRKRGLRLFQRRMEEHAPGVAGTSLSAIQIYLRGESEPSLGFVKIAARLLSVREPWLAWGDGAPTEAEEAGRRETPEAELFRISTAVYEALEVPTKTAHPDGLPTEVERFWSSAGWAPMARQTMLRLYQHRPAWELLSGRTIQHPSSGPEADDSWRAAVADTAKALAAPLHGLGIDPALLPLDEVADYVQSVALSLQRVIYTYNPSPQRTQEPPLVRERLDQEES